MKNIIFIILAFLLGASCLPAQVLQKGQAIYTFNVQGKVAEIIDVRNNSLACQGLNWSLSAGCASQANITNPPNWTFNRMGAIFGTAIDQPGDVFFAASPILGLTAVKDSGIIFRADAANLNSVSDFILNTNTYSSVINTNTIPNKKNGFGNIAYDRWHNQLFATNLLDGKIYRISGLGNLSGNVESVFTPPFNTFSGNINNPVQPGSKCWGIGVNRDNDGVVRVYFTVEMVAPALAEVWSVELDGSGEFLPGSAVMEFQGPNPYKITDLAFAEGNRMLIAERQSSGDHDSEVWEYNGTHLAWAREANKVEVGDYSNHENSAGGVDYGYRQPAGNTMTLGECAKLIWASSDAIHYPSPYIYGICAVPSDPYVGTFWQNGILVDLNDNVSTGTKGSLGDVEIYRDPCASRDICDYLSVFPKPADDPAAGDCCWKITLANEYRDDYFTGVQFCGLDGVQLSYSAVSGGWNVVQHTPTTVTISPHGGPVPIGGFPDVVQLCLDGYSTAPQQVVVKWLGPDPHQAVVCMDTLKFDCGVGDPPRCVRAVEDSLICENGKYTYKFKIQNNAPFDVQSFMITPTDPTIQVTPALTNLVPPGILSGTTSGYFTVTLSGSGAIAGNQFCFYLTAHDQPVGNGNFPQACCTDSVVVNCLTIPGCDPCDGIVISSKPIGQPDSGCCHALTLINNYLPGYFTGVQINGLNGVQLSYVSGWTIQPPVLPSSITLIPPGGTVDTTTYSNFAEICLNGFSTPTQEFVVSLLGPNGEVVCSDTIKSDCPPPPPPTCAVAVSDSLWCDGGQVKYTFSLLNAPANTFDIYSFNLVLADPVGIQVSQDYFILPTPLMPGNTAGPFTIDLWGSSVQPGNPFCYVITAHDGIWTGSPDEYPTTCCTDSVQVRCLPIPDCSKQDSCCCCIPSTVQVPTGFSPNNDGLNDFFVVQGIDKCKHATLTVFNRWGNIVYQKDDYDNSWDGTNDQGNDLPQGTYFVLLTLHDSGSTVSSYVDLRRL